MPQPNAPTRADDERLLEMLHLRFCEGRSYNEIAALLNVTTNTVIGQLNRMKPHLKGD